MVNGRRELDEEKLFVTQLSKAVHVTKANVAQQKIVNKAEKKRARNVGDKATEITRPAQRGASKKASRGGSVWITLKGSFASANVDATEQKRRADFRAKLAQSRRTRDEQRAGEYLESAFAQAKEAGLLDTSGVAQSEEGVSYLEQQYDVAAGMLRRPPIGHHVSAIIAAANTAPVTEPVPNVDSATRAWAEQSAIREASILARGYTVAEGVEAAPTSVADTTFVEENANQLMRDSLFLLREPTEPVPVVPNAPVVDGAITHDVVPTKCIMKVRSSAGKSTCVLTNQKAVTTFKQNLSLFLKKEVAPLLRDSTHESSPSKKKVASTPAKKVVADTGKKRK